MTTVLLIEDDTVLRENTAELLELSGYKVLTASNGKIGVSLAKKQYPDIIICDIMMPELDGYAALKILSKNKLTKHIPFIFLSAKTERSDVRKGMNLGADDYITKPFTEEDLVTAIESRLAKVSILKDIKQNDNIETPKPDDELKTLNDLKIFFDDYGEASVFKNEAVIYNEGDHSNYIYLISKGAVKCFRRDEKGKELVTALYKEDDLFGYTSFTQNTTYKETAAAIADTKLIGLSIIDFKSILNKNHKLVIELIELLTDDISNVKTQLLQMAYGTVSQKTAATILKFAEKMNRKPDDPIKISRNDLASVAGIATETLIRALTEFKKQGIIKADGRNIKVIDIEKLKQVT
ncbi:cAMP-binding domain of CRP or a regulatory subunit of cAMP-dependent protein kinases [Hyunsoonleella jejuensis]|uniref:cAMP-binding domain of CRP or a regulatory subunit of cAMP-dependent protein kinases n=1 Tax=Hyunsoonleella jejuensis TaxID=419940 RepID=A0A1H9FBQ4_9FLAO|nr:response regulator [Hyunsoonleella jejuensis]SEQ35362.1 cAMP-binding domain of CRP or a regulatory subunit of cAMP-dependent protein kinases [Hyunsoonleella jejuensis]